MAWRISAPAPGREGEGQNAHHERERGHEDRTQPQAARLDRGFDRRLPGEFELAREFHDQDRVLRRETHEDDEPDLREDVVVAVHRPHARHRGEEPIGTMRMIESGSTRLS
jgi:hypothetical protein